MPKHNTDKLLTTTEAAFLIGVSQARVSQLIGAKKLPVERFQDGKRKCLRLRESVVLAYKQSREIPDALPNQTAQAA